MLRVAAPSLLVASMTSVGVWRSIAAVAYGLRIMVIAKVIASEVLDTLGCIFFELLGSQWLDVGRRGC